MEFRPGQEAVTVPANANGRPVASMEIVQRAWFLLKAAQQLLDSGKNARPTIGMATEELAKVLPPDRPPLPPFQVVGEPLIAFRWDFFSAPFLAACAANSFTFGG